MKWYYTTGPSHTRIRVFMNGANCGELCFRNEEFDWLLRCKENPFVTFINETR